MSTKLITIKDYLLLIDEEAEIKEGFLIYNSEYQKVSNTTKEYMRAINSNKTLYRICKKIIAYYPLTTEAKELDLPLLPNPFEGDTDVEKLAKEYIGMNPDKEWDSDEDYYNPKNREYYSFIDGYKAAQSKQFSLEDMKEAIDLARRNSRLSLSSDEIIQSLSTQQLPKEFVPEYDIVHTDHAPNGFEKLLKFKTNSEGKRVLIGNYKY